MKAKFQLAGEHTSLRIALQGGLELALDGSAVHETDDPAEIAALDAHPAAERVGKQKEPQA